VGVLLDGDAEFPDFERGGQEHDFLEFIEDTLAAGHRITAVRTVSTDT
jgi:hypothetical protein